MDKANLLDWAEKHKGGGSENPPAEIISIQAQDLMMMEIPPRRLILTPWLGAGDQVAMYGKRGQGKTWATLGTALAVSSGGSLWGWQAQKPARVLFIDGEMMARRLQGRLLSLMRSTGMAPGDHLSIITPDIQKTTLSALNLYTKAGRDAVEHHVETLGGVDLIIFDNISTLYRGGEENTSEWWQPFQDWIVSWKMKGIATISALHSGKDGDRGPRGASKVEDALETSIEIKQPEDWAATDGASFIIEFRKARDFSDGMEPLHVELADDAWVMKSLRGSKREQDVTDDEMDARVLRAIADNPGKAWSEINHGLGKAVRASQSRNRLEARSRIRVERGTGIDYRKLIVWPVEEDGPRVAG